MSKTERESAVPGQAPTARSAPWQSPQPYVQARQHEPESMTRRARSVDITDFRVGQHVLFARDNGDQPRKGLLTVIDPQRPFPATVTFDDGFTEQALPWELTSVPASRSIDDVERWLNER